jgi:DNA polymerase III epsilon subunit-like protein
MTNTLCHVPTVYLDVETTGLEPEDEVLERAIVDEDARVQFHTLVRPTCRAERPAAQEAAACR